MAFSVIWAPMSPASGSEGGPEALSLLVAAGVATFLIRHDDLDLTNIRSGEKLSKFITEDLMNQAATLGIADVRSQSSPHGAGRR